ATWATDAEADHRLDRPAPAARHGDLPDRRLGAERALRTAHRVRLRDRGHLLEPRAGARADLPRDAGDQLRTGRAGDLLGIHRVAALAVGAVVLERLCTHDSDV